MTTSSIPSTTHTMIPFKHLLLSRHNVRDRPSSKESIAELAATLRTQNVLHNLVVHPIAGKGKKPCYGVADGGRRLQAFAMLIEDDVLTPDVEIPCRIVSEDEAEQMSLIANIQREQMHPANEFLAFQKLVNQGKSVTQIADTFGVAELIVKRRLKLANVAPALIEAYRNEEMSLECLMAFSITDNQERQIEVWKGLGRYDRDAAVIKDTLTEHELNISSSLARFVGVKAYEKAGGAIRRDLFAEKTSDGFMMDTDLVQTLAQAKLDKLKEALLAEGYAWVETTLGQQYELRREFEAIPTTLRPLAAKEQKKLDKLTDEFEKANAELEAMDEEDTQWETLSESRDQLEADLSTFTESLTVPDPRFDAVRGAIIAIDRSGKADYARNLVRPADRKTIVRTTPAIASDGSHSAEPVVTDEAVSASMSSRLTSALTQSMQATLISNTHVTLALLAEKMARKLLGDAARSSDNPLGIDVRAPQYPRDLSLNDSLAGRAIADAVARWSARLPTEDLLSYLLGLSTDELMELLTLCTALTFSAVTAFASIGEMTKAVAQASHFDVRAWWQPTAANYFQYVNKAAIAATLAEAGDSEAAGRIASLKKGEAVSEAETAISKTTWLPSLMRL